MTKQWHHIHQHSGMQPMPGCLYLYGLADPDSHDVRYVGQSKSPVDRFKFHMLEIGPHPKGDWIRELRSEGKEPVLIPLALTSSRVPSSPPTSSARAAKPIYVSLDSLFGYPSISCSGVTRLAITRL